VAHRNAPLTVTGRRLMCRRIEAGEPIAHVAEAMGISRRCVSKWWHRYLELGDAGLCDRSSRPDRSPARLSERVEDRIVRARRRDKVGPDRLAIHLDLPASTIYRVLVRHDLNRLSHMDRRTGTPIRRYERSRPGELVHVDVKKLGRIRVGGGHRVHGRQATRKHRRGRVGYHYLHTAIDDHSRLAYTESLPDEKGATAAGFWRRAEAWFRAHGITVERVLTDNAFSYRGRLFNDALAERRILHKYCRPYRPQTNGKVCEHDRGAAPGRSDPGKGVTVVSFVRFVDRIRCCAQACTGRTDLT
jgi:integrase-like protein/homeodomain-containing protein